MEDRAISEEGPEPLVPPSCSIEEAASHGVWDAIVVGAGVAGSSIARRLAQRGHAVLLVEKKKLPRYKVCGCCLNLRSLHYLEEAGLSESLHRLDAPTLNSISLHAGSHCAALPLPGGMAVSRNALDVLLVRAAHEAGATLLLNTKGSLAHSASDDSRGVTLSNREGRAQVMARLVVAADGLGGKLIQEAGSVAPRIARGGHIGLGALATAPDSDLISGQIRMLCNRRGYVGLVRVESGALALAAAVQPTAVREAGGAASCIEAMFRDGGQAPPTNLSELDWQGTPMLTRCAGSLRTERLVVLGDAAGYIEPFTGEGMAWAMEAASQLDIHLEGFSPKRWEEGAKEWERVHRGLLAGRRYWCRGLSKALRFPRLTMGAVKLLARVPALSTPVVTALNSVVRS
jgi:menaquinone-9 beta-reductase